MNKELLVIDIERFAIHDGPGIRTLVFLQGCPLNCRWCSNPESQAYESQLMFQKKKCIGCGACVKYGEEKAVEMVDGYPVFDRSKKYDWKRAIKHCPSGAIRLSSEIMDIDHLIEVILKDQAYYDKTRGGLTVSGGEAFVQFEGLLTLLIKAKEKGLHTVIETSAHVPLNQLKEVLPYVDGFLIDYKQADSKKFKEFAGGDNQLITKNLSYLANHGKEKVSIRIPVVPGFNASVEEMKKNYKAIKEIGYQEVVLLPYHVLGMSKYKQLNINYEMSVKKGLTKKDLKKYVDLGQEMGLVVSLL